MKKTELIDRLRDYFNLNHEQATDEEILIASKGTIARASIELNMAYSEFWSEVKKALKGYITKKH